MKDHPVSPAKSLALFLTTLCLLGFGEQRAAEAAEPSFDELVKLNAGLIFGGNLRRNKSRFTLSFPAEGQFDRAFDSKRKGRGAIYGDLRNLKSPLVRKILVEGHTKGKPSLVALQSGSALSRFPLLDDYTVRFRLRIPKLDSRAKLVWMLNRKSTREVVHSNFFQDLVVVGTKTRVRTKNAKFAVAPTKWFDRGNQGMPIVIKYKGGKLSIHIGVIEKKGKKQEEKLVEVVATTVETPVGGRIGFSFDRVSFLMSDLVVEGKFPREWVEEEIARLRKTKKLRTKDEAAEVAKKGESASADSKTVRLRRRSAKPDLGKPDPEADDDL